MTLPKHLRPRWRYLAVQLRTWPDVTLARGDLERALEEAIRSLYGDEGVATTDHRLVQFRHQQGVGEAIVRVRREATREVRAALACIRSVENHPVGVQVQGTSGTIRACEENYLGSGAEPMSENTVVYEGAERPAFVRGEEVDVRVDDAFVGATRLDLE